MYTLRTLIINEIGYFKVRKYIVSSLKNTISQMKTTAWNCFRDVIESKYEENERQET